MSVDLVAFLRDRIAEDEQAARAATPGPWKWDHDEFAGEPCLHGDSWGAHGPDLVTVAEEEVIEEREPNWMSPVATIISSSGYDASSLHISRPDAEYIARHDPARVLADVAAKRRVIEKCTHYLDDCEGADVLAEWVLELLAQPYADHPQFREEWKT